MKFGQSHLSWCLNIYPGESWAETRENVHVNAVKVRKLLEADSRTSSLISQSGLGLGMRIANECANELHGNTQAFKKELEELNLYVFTVNAFPFGNFHKKPVKQNVYYPDWSSKERLDYTVKTAEILADLLPEGISGSISTVPVTYGKELPEGAVENLIACAQKLKELEEKTGKLVKVALEPEPDCYLERTDESIDFFNILREKDKELAERYLGICLDTCHMALQFEKPIDSLNKLIEANVPIPKIQISSVLSLDSDKHSPSALNKFNEEVYLHQTLVKENGVINQFPDLGDAFKENPKGEWRVHFHVPLYFNGNDEGIGSTSNLLDEEFMKRAFEACVHLETETYTYGVLPDAQFDVNQSIANELLFVVDKLK
ncbi:MAG: metabolite traffic protein EboE [Lentisphaeraceae bacterium]|nr:metabolite traffic protein EboE [Lentisphaeraceae bacterium]